VILVLFAMMHVCILRVQSHEIDSEHRRLPVALPVIGLLAIALLLVARFVRGA